MPTVKPSYKLSELEKAWKSFKPMSVRDTGLSKYFNACGDLEGGLNKLRTQKEAKRWAELFSETMKKMDEVRKLDAVKKDKDILLFLTRAGDSLSSGPETKLLWQIVAGNLVWDDAAKKWEKSASIKRQVGQG